MRKFLVLAGLSFRSMLCSLRVGGGSKKRVFTGAGTLALMAVLALYLSGTYSFLFASQLRRAGMLPLLIMMMPVLAVVAGFFFTVFAAQGVVFGGRDSDLMLALPVAPFVLLLARVCALYLENLFLAAFVLLPAAAAYLAYGGAGGGFFFVAMLAGAAIIALIPTFFALVLGFLLAWISSRFTRRSALSILLHFALLALVFVFSFRISFLLRGLAQEAAGIARAFSGWGLPFVLLKEAACDESLLSLLLLLCLCLGPFLLVTWLLATRYHRIVTSLGERGARSDYRLGSVPAGGRRKALFAKEAARFFGTPIYLFNAGLGLILLLIAGGAALIQRDLLTELMGQITGLGPQDVLPLLAGAVCFLLSTVTVTACSINLEGRQLWIIRSAPVHTRELFLIKTGFQLALSLPCLVFGVAALALGFGLSLSSALLLLSLCASFALFTAPFGLLVNLLFPKLDPVSDMAAVKQSASTIIGIFASMLLVLLGGGLWFLTGSPALCLAVTAAFAAAAWLLLLKKGPALFAAL